METLADLSPEKMKASGSAAGAGKRPERAKPVTAAEQAAWDARVAKAEASQSGRRTMAPLAVAGAAVLAVVGVITWSVLSSGVPLTVETMPSPVVAADGGGSAVYPANSAEAVRENVRFGFIPAVDLVELGDGTVVLGAGGPDAGEDVYGSTYADLTLEEFAKASIPAPREDTAAGTPVTWSDAYGEFAEDTVFMPAVDSDVELEAVLSAAKDVGRVDALIIRTSDADLAAAISGAGATALFDGDLEGTTPEQLADESYGMVVVSVDDAGIGDWTASGLGVWAADVDTADELATLAGDNVLGAITAAPFALQQSSDEDS